MLKLRPGPRRRVSPPDAARFQDSRSSYCHDAVARSCATGSSGGITVVVCSTSAHPRGRDTSRALSNRLAGSEAQMRSHRPLHAPENSSAADCHSAPWSVARGLSRGATRSRRARVEHPIRSSCFVTTPPGWSNIRSAPSRPSMRTLRCAGLFIRMRTEVRHGMSPAGGARTGGQPRPSRHREGAARPRPPVHLAVGRSGSRRSTPRCCHRCAPPTRVSGPSTGSPRSGAGHA